MFICSSISNINYQILPFPLPPTWRSRQKDNPPPSRSRQLLFAGTWDWIKRKLRPIFPRSPHSPDTQTPKGPGHQDTQTARHPRPNTYPTNQPCPLTRAGAMEEECLGLDTVDCSVVQYSGLRRRLGKGKGSNPESQPPRSKSFDRP